MKIHLTGKYYRLCAEETKTLPFLLELLVKNCNGQINC